MHRIALVSILPPRTASHLLALRQLKGLMDDAGLSAFFEVRFHLLGTDEDPDSAVDRLLAEAPNLVAFSVYIWNALLVECMCACIKRVAPEVLIVLGGAYAAFFADRYLLRAGVDVVVRGPGEPVFNEILRRVRKGSPTWEDIPNLLFLQNGKVVENQRIPDVDVSDFHYDLHLEPRESEHLYYETSRGCPFRCRYCSWNSDAQRKCRFYPGSKIERDLKAIFGHRDITVLYFCDSDLFLKRDHGLWVLRQVHRLNAQRRAARWKEIAVSFEINPEFLDDETIEEIARLPAAPNTIACGLQTIREEVHRNHLNRTFHRDAYAERLKSLRKRCGDRIGVEMIYGLPGDSYEGVTETMEFLVSEMDVSQFVCYRFLVLPGSYFWEHTADYGIIHQKAPPHAVVENRDFSREELDSLQKLVCCMYLFFTVIRGVKKIVDRRIPTRRMEVYQILARHIEKDYPEFLEKFLSRFDARMDFETLLEAS